MEKEKIITEEKTVKDITKMNIYEKMAMITEEMGIVEKSLKVNINQSQSYKAVSERDILDTVKPIEMKYRVYSYPVERNIVNNETLVKETEYNEKITRTNTLFMRLETIYRFVNIDNSNEFIDIKTYGDGLDTGDKAPGKAMTYGDKYALMKAYKISTGDDPDKEASPESGFAKKEVKETKAIESQIKTLKEKLTEEQIKKALEMVKREKLEDMTVQEASSLISKIGGEK